MPAMLANRAAFTAARPATGRAARSTLRVQAATWQKATTKEALKSAGGKQVVELDKER